MLFCSLKLNPANLVLANQVHANDVVVNVSDKNTFVDNWDGLIKAEEEIVLGVLLQTYSFAYVCGKQTAQSCSSPGLERALQWNNREHSGNNKK